MAAGTALATLVGLGAACGSPTSQAQAAETSAASRAVPATLRLGYLVNLTHADAMVGVTQGLFSRYLGPKTHLQTSTFNAGPAEVDALDEGALDAAYMGPSSAITPYEQSQGRNIEVISGATSGGAALVVAPSITGPGQLKGKTLSTPQLGNTQDVALRYWLKTKGLTASTNGGGDVTVLPQSNSATVTSFASGRIDGAWVPEPYATEMVKDGGHVLVDESTLWPHGRFPTTALVVRKPFAQAYPTVIKELLEGQVAITSFIQAHSTQAQRDVNEQFTALAGKSLNASVLATAWKHLTFTDDPIVSAWSTDAAHASAVSLGVGRFPVKGIFSLSILNQVLAAAHQPPVPTK